MGDDALTAALTVHPPPAHAMPELESAIADGEAANDDVVGTREMRAELEKDGVVLPDEDDISRRALRR